MPKRSLTAMANERQPPSNILVSFSKRRMGLYRKAAELCIKCDSQIAIVVLSQTGNPYAFGHSSVDDVLHHYLRGQTTINSVMSRAHEYQTQQVEGLRVRLKQQEQNRETKALNEENKVRQWIEEEWEASKSAEQLEFLKQKYLTLLDKIKTRLGSTPPSSSNDVVVVDDGACFTGFEFGDALLDNNLLDYANPGEFACGVDANQQNPDLYQIGTSDFAGKQNGDIDSSTSCYDSKGVGMLENRNSENIGFHDFYLNALDVPSFAMLGPLNDMSYANYGTTSTSGVVGLLEKHIPGDNSFLFAAGP